MIPEIATEVDRQLAEQRAISESLATRAGLMVGVTSALLAVAATRSTAQTTDPRTGYWLIGIAAVLGVIVFWAARIGVGPSPARLTTVSSADLALSKVLLLEANSRVLLRVQVLFSLQVLTTIAGVLALVLMMWGLP
ncbi:hypothetical protein ABXJ56_12480 [Microbacterium chocolatum]|uniref:hypothetical protein n=1 Tax=Microbacterium aurantiacum TaxID=162393 RepID=UPI00338EA8C2